MSGGTDAYTTKDVAALLGISTDAVRMRINRGHFPARHCHGRLVIPKRELWRLCAQQEADGQIRLGGMPQTYKDERRLFLGDLTFDHNILYGKRGVR